MGDRVGFFGFDVQPRLFSGAVSGAHAFPFLQRIAARLDYSTEETNYTLALTQLGAALERRSLIVVFTDFADTTSAQLMLENVGRLIKRHLVLFVIYVPLALVVINSFNSSNTFAWPPQSPTMS